MTTDEADKIIAAYMNFKLILRGDTYFIGNHKELCVSDIYSESLDALVPVWEKLDYIKVLSVISRMKMFLFKPVALERIGESTIQESVAIATAKAILGINSIENGELE